MKRWTIVKSDILGQKELSEALNISPIIAQLLINRGLKDVDSARTFLKGDISELYNPFLMEGMHEAVSRIKKAVKKKERVLIHGDYDVDGITSVALCLFMFRALGLDVFYYIPDRINEGYGLSEAGVKKAIDVNADLVVTVDCGISSHEEVRLLNEKNIDVIITDHHEVPTLLPSAYAIINPLQKHCAYPDKNLSGVAVAFKLCEAICSEFHIKEVWKHLDLVALGTISDISPLVGENRILVREGLKLLKNGNCNRGIKALMEVGRLKNKNLGTFDIGFILGPRINAAGRVGTANTAVELLLSDSDEKALNLAEKLDAANKKRQKIERDTLKKAMNKIERDINFKEHKIIVLHEEDWHTGVIGIVASRISDKFYRPCILISLKDGLGRGSGRSIENFHLFEALTECENFLQGFGGHKYACGLTILERDISDFKKSINDIAGTVLTSERLIPSLDIDMEIPLNLLDNGLVATLEMLEPFGEGNARPVFCSKNLTLSRSPMVLKGEHIKLWVNDGLKNFEAIGFSLAKDNDMVSILESSPRIDLAYTVSFNNWQGINSIQLKLEDIRPS